MPDSAAAAPVVDARVAPRVARRGRLRGIVRAALALAVGLLAARGSLASSRAWLEKEAGATWSGDRDAERSLALGAASWPAASPRDFATGAELFDREWAFGAPMMRTACLAQVLLRHPTLEPELGPELDRAAAEVLSPEARAFTIAKWGSDPLDGEDVHHDHAAYLGYGGFAMGLATLAHPRWSDERDRFLTRLRERFAAAAPAWPETYPGEAYPVDVAAGVGALALGEPRPSRERVHAQGALAEAVDPASGLLVQSVEPASGAVVDGPRGSGTFLGAYFLTFADSHRAQRLYERGRDHLAASRLGFLGMRERLAGDPGGGDVDSGPIVWDLGVSASGFALGGARAFGDEATFRGLDATARLFGVPLRRDDGGLVHLAGGPLGDAILCAMRTAASPEELAGWRATSSPTLHAEGGT